MKGFIDFPSNLITQQVARPHDLWRQFIENGAFPNRLMQLFLHEINHHWFFQSPVGTALALLRNSSRDLLLRSDIDNNSEAEVAMIEDAVLLYFRYLAARRLFDTIFEGAALFHEFFVSPGNSRIVSQPSLLGYVLFVPEMERIRLRGVNFDLNKVNAQWKEAVKEYRLSAEGISDKCRLLECPLEGEGRGTYLRGYLMFCHLYNLCKQTTQVLGDPELFISFIRSLLMQDPIMVDNILKDDSPIGEWLQAIMDRFQQRMGLISHQRTEEEAIELENRIVREDPHWAVFTPRKALQDMERLMKGRCFKPVSSNYHEIDLLRDRYRYIGRGLVRLAIEKGEVEVDTSNNTVYLKQSGECFALGKVEKGLSTKGGGNGYCVLYLLPQPIKNILYQIGTDRTPLFLEFSKPIEQRLRKAFMFQIHYQEMIGTIEDGFDQTFEDVLSKFIISGRTLCDILNEWSAYVEKFEYNLALAPLLPNSAVHWSTVMKRKGFAGLFDRDHVRSLALLGLFSSVGYNEEMVRNILSTENFDFDKECSFLNELSRVSGFPIIAPSDGREFSVLL